MIQLPSDLFSCEIGSLFVNGETIIISEKKENDVHKVSNSEQNILKSNNQKNFMEIHGSYLTNEESIKTEVLISFIIKTYKY